VTGPQSPVTESPQTVPLTSSLTRIKNNIKRSFLPDLAVPRRVVTPSTKWRRIAHATVPTYAPIVSTSGYFAPPPGFYRRNVPDETIGRRDIDSEIITTMSLVPSTARNVPEFSRDLFRTATTVPFMSAPCLQNTRVRFKRNSATIAVETRRSVSDHLWLTR